MVNFLDKLENKFWEKVDPPVKTIYKPEHRDAKKAGTRRGPNGTSLSRGERAQHLDNDRLRQKLDNAQRKMSENFGGATRATGEAVVTTKALHWHLTPGRAIKAATNTAKTVEQIPRYNDYEKEYIARGFEHKRPNGATRGDIVNGFLGNHRTAKQIEKPAQVADGLQTLYDATRASAVPAYCKFDDCSSYVDLD
jgi:hypothetical protein